MAAAVEGSQLAEVLQRLRVEEESGWLFQLEKISKDLLQLLETSAEARAQALTEPYFSQLKTPPKARLFPYKCLYVRAEALGQLYRCESDKTKKEELLNLLGPQFLDPTGLQSFFEYRRQQESFYAGFRSAELLLDLLPTLKKGSPRENAVLKVLLTDNSSVDALVRKGYLEPCLKHPDPEVQGAAAKAIIRRGAESSPALLTEAVKLGVITATSLFQGLEATEEKQRVVDGCFPLLLAGLQNPEIYINSETLLIQMMGLEGVTPQHLGQCLRQSRYPRLQIAAAKALDTSVGWGNADASREIYSHCQLLITLARGRDTSLQTMAIGLLLRLSTQRGIIAPAGAASNEEVEFAFRQITETLHPYCLRLARRLKGRDDRLPDSDLAWVLPSYLGQQLTARLSPEVETQFIGLLAFLCKFYRWGNVDLPALLHVNEFYKRHPTSEAALIVLAYRPGGGVVYDRDCPGILALLPVWIQNLKNPALPEEWRAHMLAVLASLAERHPNETRQHFADNVPSLHRALQAEIETAVPANKQYEKEQRIEQLLGILCCLYCPKEGPGISLTTAAFEMIPSLQEIYRLWAKDERSFSLTSSRIARLTQELLEVLRLAPGGVETAEGDSSAADTAPLMEPSRPVAAAARKKSARLAACLDALQSAEPAMLHHHERELNACLNFPEPGEEPLTEPHFTRLKNLLKGKYYGFLGDNWPLQEAMSKAFLSLWARGKNPELVPPLLEYCQRVVENELAEGEERLGAYGRSIRRLQREVIPFLVQQLRVRETKDLLPARISVARLLTYFAGRDSVAVVQAGGATALVEAFMTSADKTVKSHILYALSNLTCGYAAKEAEPAFFDQPQLFEAVVQALALGVHHELGAAALHFVSNLLDYSKAQRPELQARLAEAGVIRALAACGKPNPEVPPFSLQGWLRSLVEEPVADEELPPRAMDVLVKLAGSKDYTRFFIAHPKAISCLTQSVSKDSSSWTASQALEALESLVADQSTHPHVGGDILGLVGGLMAAVHNHRKNAVLSLLRIFDALYAEPEAIPHKDGRWDYIWTIEISITKAVKYLAPSTSSEAAQADIQALRTRVQENVRQVMRSREEAKRSLSRAVPVAAAPVPDAVETSPLPRGLEGSGAAETSPLPGGGGVGWRGASSGLYPSLGSRDTVAAGTATDHTAWANSLIALRERVGGGAVGGAGYTEIELSEFARAEGLAVRSDGSTAFLDHFALDATDAVVADLDALRARTGGDTASRTAWQAAQSHASETQVAAQKPTKRVLEPAS